MRRAFLLVLSFLVLPVAIEAQVEIGLDAGLMLQTGFEFGESVTTISIPTGSARLGFAVGENLSVESLFTISRVSSDGDSFSALRFLPGVNLAIAEGQAYVRGEVGIQRFSGNGDSESQYAVGAAVGTKRPIGDGSVHFRVEAGFDRWLENEDIFAEAFNQIRLLFGFSAVVG